MEEQQPLKNGSCGIALHELVVKETQGGGMGAIPMREMLIRESAYCLGVAQNTYTIERTLDLWVENFRKNLDKLPYTHDRNWMEHLGTSLPILVVGAGPSAKGADYSILNTPPSHDPTVFCTNKSLSYLLRDGVEPDVVFVLHSTDEIKGTIKTDEVIDYLKEKKSKTGENGLDSHFVIPSTIDSEVLGEIREVNLIRKELWFNPSVPDENIRNLDVFMGKMNGLRTIDTGGNVGTFALNMAMEMGRGSIGMIGLEHCLELDPSWTNKQARDYRIEFAPENGGALYAIPPSFMSYLETLIGLCRTKGSDRVVNLVPFGPVYTRKLLPFMNLEEFICQQQM